MEPKIRFSSSNILYEEKTLSEISTINPKTNVPLEFEYVDLESVSGTEMTNHRTEHKATAPSRAQRLAKKGDIFYQTVRPYQKNNYYFDMDDDNYVFSTGYAQIRPSIYGKYLFTLLQNDSFLKQVLDNCAGTSFPAINPSVLSRLSVRICKDKQEQQAIASYFTSLDSQISASTSRLASLKQMKAASLQAMFPQEGETVPKIRFKGFEGEWTWLKLGDISEQVKRKAPINSTAPVMMISALNGFINQSEKYSDNNAGSSLANYTLLKKGELSYNHGYSKTRNFGSCFNLLVEEARIPFVYHSFRLTNDNDSFYAYYLNSGTKDKDLKRLVSSTARMDGLLNISFKNYMELSVPHPSLAEQQAIANYFTSLDRQISLQSQRLEKLKQIKSACLDKMFV
jgi:type I restriction enzyme S subunit